MDAMMLTVLTVGTRIIVHILQRLGYGGTSLPGIWVEKHAPWLITRYASQYSCIILITGTNGKTTVQHCLLHLLKHTGRAVVSNTSGSNMLRGIATTLMIAGRPGKDATLVCEVEEATMPSLTRLLSAHVIVLTNLYRDQLDAYGELNKTAEYVTQSCLNNPQAMLVHNGDDPLIVRTVTPLTHAKHAYSLGALAGTFRYEGQVSIPQDAMVTVESVRLREDLSSDSLVREGGAPPANPQDTPIVRPGMNAHDPASADSAQLYSKISRASARGASFEMHFQPPGLYNVYNALAAYTVGRLLGIAGSHLIEGLSTVSAPFGRGEQVVFVHEGKKIVLQLFLVKNPAGYAQVWDLLRHIRHPYYLVVGLNDKVADGRDVSWIWDINLPQLSHADSLQHVCFTGTRADDMALRYKYASIRGTSQDIIQEISVCVDHLLEQIPSDRVCFALCTYTALNDLRSCLSRYTHIKPYTL